MKVLAEGKRLRLAVASQEGDTVRCRLKGAGVQSYEPTCLRADAQAGNVTKPSENWGTGGFFFGSLFLLYRYDMLLRYILYLI
ncbi:MAG: hypothetical protein LWX01_13130 [Deltaproteobacteria bacterium]|nr:hypothetical protein [Deltaproteobacteria bacterium]